MKRLAICVLVLAFVLSLGACGNKSKSKSSGANEKKDNSSSILISEDTIDGGIDIDDTDNIPELDLGVGSLGGETSTSDSASDKSDSDRNTSDSGSSSNSSGESSGASSSGNSSGTSSKDSNVSNDSMEGWEPLS